MFPRVPPVWGRLAVVAVVFLAACSPGGPPPEEAGEDPVPPAPSSRVGSASSTTLLPPVSAVTTTSTVTTTAAVADTTTITSTTTTTTTSTTTTPTAAATTTPTAVVVVDRFVSVSAGWGYACGLRESGRLKCWRFGELFEPHYPGADASLVFDLEADAPPGVFSSVSASRGFACGIRSSGEVECWSMNSSDEFEIPSGVFSSVSAGVEHVCGVRPDASTECWGGGKLICGVRPDGSTECRREPQRWRDAGVPPEGPFTDLAVGWSFTCGLRPGGEVECWGGGFNEGYEPPGGPFERLVTAGFVCGIRSGGRAECWSDSDPEEYDPRKYETDDWFPHNYNPKESLDFADLDPPGVNFRMLSARCGVDDDYRVLCWKNVLDEDVMLPTPEGEFTWVESVRTKACAVRRADSSLYCWDLETGEDLPAPEGVFREVTMGVERDCGLLISGEVSCWGQVEGSPPPPEGKFKTLREFASFLCGIRVEDGTLECWPDASWERTWPDLNWGRTPPPEGEFTDVSIARYHACGLRPSGEIECWGGWDRRPKMLPPDVGFASINAGWGGYKRGAGVTPYVDWGYSCGVRLDASLECWGDDRTIWPAEHPPEAGKRSPLLSPPVGEYEQVGVGEYFACALRVGGKVDCWGSAYGNRFAPQEQREAGEKAWGPFSYTYGDPLPVEEPPERLYPYPYGKEGALEVLPFVSISVGLRHACGLRTDFAVECWSPDAVETYHTIPDSFTYTYVDAGYYEHACAVRKIDGGVDCWDTQLQFIKRIDPTIQ